MIFDKLCDIVAQQFNIDKDTITPEMDLFDDLHLESLDLIEYVVIVEHEFDMEIPDDVTHNFTTLQDVANFIEENIR